MNAPDDGPSADVPADAPPPPPSPPLDLHDPELLPAFELTLDDAALATLSAPSQVDPDQRTWVHGAFRFGDVTFADVGVRVKGSGSYRALPAKASFKVKFNKWVKGQKLHGLEELTLNNSVDDPNYLRQRVAYHVFRAMGLPASKANSARLAINGEDYGLYANVETPDEQFLARAFGKKAIRSLYEADESGSWLPGSAAGWDVDLAPPAEAGAPAGSKPDLDRLFAAVAAAQDATLLADLAPYLHTTEWLRYCATEAILGLFDGYSYGKYFPHNYFMAGDAEGKFALVPWSTDDALDPTEPVDASQPAAGVVFSRCKASADCWSAYRTEMTSALGVYETLDVLALARRWHEQIDALAKADPKRETSLERYEETTEELYAWLSDRPAQIRVQLGL